MNVQFKATDLSCLVGDEYDRIYSTLKRNLGINAAVFAERAAGHGYLQWRLPGNGWQSLASCEGDRRAQVEAKVSEARGQIAQKFGANQDMASRILTIPDDSFVYFKEDAFGQIAICFAAWGYQYPERVSSSDINIVSAPKGATEKVTISIIRDGVALPNYPFELNGYHRTTSASGSFFVGHVEIGQKFSVAVDGVMNEYTAARGEGDIKIYLASALSEPELVKATEEDGATNAVPPVDDSLENDKREPEKPKKEERKERDEKPSALMAAALPIACIVILTIISYIVGLHLI